MARTKGTKEKWWGILSGKPEVVMRHIEIPVTLNNDPERPVVVVIPASKVPQFMKSLARAHAKATGTSAVMASLEEDGDGFGVTDRT